MDSSSPQTNSLSYPRSNWRLLLDPPAPGAWNMAVDEAVLECIGRGESLPTLRLYAWDPPCLSLGYAQPISDVEQNRLAALGWDLVRRPTGGKAILHTDELTYSVIGPLDEPRLKGNVLESYRRLAQALLKALHIIGVPAQADQESLRGGENSGPVCFEVPSNYEITVDGKKLIGSAQARRKEGVLQHGSLPLAGDLRRITSGLAFADEDQRRQAGERLLARAATVESILRKTVSWEEAADAFVLAFSRSLNLELRRGELSAGEKARAEELLIDKYQNPAWTNK